MQSYRPVVLLLLLGVIVGAALGGFQNNKNSKQQIYVDLPVGLEASVYKDRGGDGTYNYDSTKPPIENVPKGGGWIRLDRSTYDIVIDDPNNEYKETVTKVYVDYSTENIDIAPSYSDEKLAKLLPQARASALAALYAEQPLLKKHYSAGPDGLYELGDWYGVVLKPHASYIDTVRVILHKQDGKWKTSTAPLISIGAPSHRDIPYSVIDSVDRL